MNVKRFKPTVPKCWLFLASGVMWSAVGLMLGITAVRWLIPEGMLRGAGFEVAGVALATVGFRRMFGRIAQKNIRRLRNLPDRRCFFAFQAWKSYLIIVFMIALGATMRHSSIPRSILSIVYTAIGCSLISGSLPYYGYLLRRRRIAARLHTRVND